MGEPLSCCASRNKPGGQLAPGRQIRLTPSESASAACYSNRHQVPQVALDRRAVTMNQAKLTGISVQAAMTAARRQRGCFTPATRIPTSTAARTPCPAAPTPSQPRPGARVSQLPMIAAAPSAATSAPDQANASVHGSQILHGRQVPTPPTPPTPPTADLEPPTATVSGSRQVAGKNRQEEVNPGVDRKGQPLHPPVGRRPGRVRRRTVSA